MNVLIKNMEMPKGCIYANDNDQTEYCPLLNHDDVPFCQYIENEPEIAIGIGERPVYCPLSDVPEPCENTVSRQAAIDALDEIESEVADGYGYQYEKWRKYFCELPSAQPERKTGRWVDAYRSKRDGTRYWFRQCDQCLYERDDCDPEKDTKFCPDCGADMTEEQNETD